MKDPREREKEREKLLIIGELVERAGSKPVSPRGGSLAPSNSPQV